MTWTARTNSGATGLGNGRADSSSGASFRTKGARLAVLVAQRLIDDCAEPHPSMEGAVLVRKSAANSNSLMIVWPTPELPVSASPPASPSEHAAPRRAFGMDSSREASQEYQHRDSEDEIDRSSTEGGDHRVRLPGDAGSERQRVTETLDQLAATLEPYVDEAMTAAYGTDWTEHVAKEDATRSSDGKRFPVSKNGLQVLLKQIQHRQIKPWGTRSDHARIGAYAAEVLSVRNLWSHGGTLQGEHGRLVDTVRRLLDTLDLPIPESIVPAEPGGSNANMKSGRSALPTDLVAATAGPDAVQEAVDRLGESVRRPAQIFTAWVEDNAWVELGMPLHPGDVDNFDDVLRALLLLNDAVAEVDEILAQSAEIGSGLPRVLALLTKEVQLSVISPIRKQSVEIGLLMVENMKLLRDLDADQRGAFLARLATVNEERDQDWIRICEEHELEVHESDWRVQQIRSAPGADPTPAPPLDPVELRDRAIKGLKARHGQMLREIEWFDGPREETFDHVYATIQPLKTALTQVSADPSRLAAQAIRAASGLPEGLKLGHQALFCANFTLYGLLEEQGDSALAPLREAITQQRTLVDLAPTADIDAVRRLASLLHMEGRLCNDLGLPDEAVRAFARADENVDHYPLADPFLTLPYPGEVP